MKHTYMTKGTCSRRIDFELDGNVVKKVRFLRRCSRNPIAIPRLVEGMTVDEVVAKCGGVNCAGKGTSCADQLAKAVLQAYSQEN